MIDSVLKYCHQWNVYINVDKSSITVFTKSRSQPVVDIRFADQADRMFRAFWHFVFISFKEQR